MDAGVAIPSDVDPLAADPFAKLPDPLLVHREGLVEERDGPDPVVVPKVAEFLQHAVRGTVLPRRLGDRAKGARERTSFARVQDCERPTCRRRNEVRIEGVQELVRGKGDRVVVRNGPGVVRDRNVAVLPVRDAGHEVEPAAILERVDERRPDALVFVTQVDVERQSLSEDLGRHRAKGPANADRAGFRVDPLRKLRHAQVVVKRRRCESQDQRIVWGAPQPRLHLGKRGVFPVRIEQPHTVALREEERRELEQAVRFEDRVAFDHFTAFLADDGVAVEPGRVDDRDVHDASPPRSRS